MSSRLIAPLRTALTIIALRRGIQRVSGNGNSTAGFASGKHPFFAGFRRVTLSLITTVSPPTPWEGRDHFSLRCANILGHSATAIAAPGLERTMVRQTYRLKNFLARALNLKTYS